MALAQAVNGVLRKVPNGALYIMCVIPLGWWLWLGVNDALGPEPVKELEHRLGLLALQLLVAGLAITPLRRFTGISLIKQRRAIGLIAFFYVTAHLAVWLLLDVRGLVEIWTEIVKRPYITVGMAAFVVLVPLAVTSNNASVRRLGSRWRSLHKLVYPAVILGAVHFVMIQKVWETEPLVYLGLILALLATRVRISPQIRARIRG